MHCDICAENVQPKLPRPAIPRQVLDFNERRPGHFEFASLVWCNEIGEMFEYRVSWNSVPDDHSAVVGDDGSGCETCAPRRLASGGHVIPNKLFLILSVKILHDIFLDPLELNSVETGDRCGIALASWNH